MPVQNLPGVAPKARRKVSMNALGLDQPQASAVVVTGVPSANGIVLFDDGGLLPGGRAEAPHTRPLHAVASLPLVLSEGRSMLSCRKGDARIFLWIPQSPR
jgi:hypothetical protein